MKTFPFPTIWFLIVATAAMYDCSLAVDNNRNGTGACLYSERVALLQFKRDLVDGANRLSSWVDSGSGSNCCNWAGIVCNNQTGHVNEIRLRGLDDNSCASRKNFYGTDTEYEAAALQRLGGKINPSLAALKQLQYLDLSCNDFKGIQIPSFIGSFENLTYLDLSDSRFSEEIPSQLGNLSALRVLNVRKLSGNEYEQTVKNLQWLSSLSLLQQLDMSGIDLSEVLDWVQVIDTLPSLVELHLSLCRLPPFPPRLTGVNLSSLSVLDLADNDFSTSLMPGWIFSLSGLVSLDLTNCAFPGQTLGGNGARNYCNLREISLAWNGFSGSLSDVLKGLFECETPQLESLKFASNRLSGVLPDQLGRLKNLVHLDLNNNNISGSIPDSIGNLSSLESVELGYNSISGTIPGSIGSLSSLRSLYLPMNSISGPIPDSMGNLSSLEELYLQSNSISGRIPDSLGRLSSLQKLDLSYNNLNGSFPESLGQLVSLLNLILDDNLLTGVVTESHFVNLSNLVTLRAKENALTLRLEADNWVPPFQLKILVLSSWNLGPKFPSWLRSQRNLFILYLANTGFSDTIPGWFQNIFSGLGYLDLSSNTLSGSSPEEILCAGIEEPKPLIYINLGYAALSGSIPDCWTRFKFLNILNLRKNNLSGEIPSSLGNVSSLESLNMRDNKLSGGLPEYLMNSGSLLIIDLSRNELNGSIPGSIGSEVTRLKLLSLHSNKLEGNIPKELCRLTTLQILDLADNNLSGNIPRCLNNFSVMTGKENTNKTVGLDGNEFIGSASLQVKARDNTYVGILGLVILLDLSGNNFIGNIPSEVTDLAGLIFLNLSGNQLTGRIPEKIGEMNQLESLDLSVNHLVGEIPSSMSSLHFLNWLNLSYNNLTGRIPTSAQLQSLDNSSFVGNGLCGLPLTNGCRDQASTTDNKGSDGENDNGSDGRDWGLVVSIVLGFVIGFWVVIGLLLVSKSWRNAYFCFWLETLDKFLCCRARK